jgi:hypothetical protein
MYCYFCGTKIIKEGKIGRQETCSECNHYLHCCLNCRFYSSTSYHQCLETQAEWVREKDSANFCGYFEPNKTVRDLKSVKDKADEARRKLDQLFKG